MGYIELEDMVFHARHGCYSEERIIGNKFIVQLTLHTDLKPAAETDDISNALNYTEAYDIVKAEMNIPSSLLEHVAGRISDRLFDHFKNLNEATVKISKVNPPIGGEMGRVSVTLSRKK